jgi:hypothetical protein
MTLNMCKKIDPPNVLMEEKDVIVVVWSLNMQKHGFSISLQ